MRIGKVVGNVVPANQYPTLSGGRFVILEIQDRFALAGQQRKTAEVIVSYDILGVGVGDLVAVTESGEATPPFLPEKTVPIDAFVSAILDRVEVSLAPLSQP
jgi:microcompartment protein CcmK/EutM